MLKISEMAKLANTTRRTLIFYDEENLFCPEEKTEAGYRLYDYNQLYDLLLILGLRNLGMSVDKIRRIQTQSDPSINNELISVQKDLDQKIEQLTKIQSIIDRKISEQDVVTTTKLYQPLLINRPKVFFWCSQESASCTDEEVAEMFSTFYQNLDDLAFMDANQSGFLTTLPYADPKGYEDAAFRVIKESSQNQAKRTLPRVTKSAGNYVSIKTGGDMDSIQKGLGILQEFCRQNDYQIMSDLWQINEGNNLSEHGGTEHQYLEYLVVNK